MAEGLLPPVILELRAKTSEMIAGLNEAKAETKAMAEETEKSTGRAGTAFKGLASAGKAVTFGVAGAAVAIGGFALEAATSGSVVDAKLSTAIKNAGGSMEELEPKIDATDATMRKFGFTNEQTNTALATVTTSLHDPAKALGVMSVAADLAREKHMDLNSAALMVTKAMEGQTKPLKALGIDLPIAAGNALAVSKAQAALAAAQQKVNDILHKSPDAVNASSKAHAAYVTAVAASKAAQEKLTATQDSSSQIMAALTKAVGGQAAAYGDTLPGKVAAAKAGLDSMAETLGKKLIPFVTSAITEASKFASFLADHTGLLYTVAGIIGGVMVAAITAYVASLAIAAVQSVMSFAQMIAGGVAWAATQAASFTETAALYAMYVGEALASAATWAAGMVASAATAAAGWLVSMAGMVAEAVVAGAAMILPFLPLILTIAAIGIAAYELYSHWKQVWGFIKDVAEDAWDLLKKVFGFIVTLGIDYVKMEILIFKTIWNAIWTAISDTVTTIWDALKAVFNLIVTVGIDYVKAEILVFKTIWDLIWTGVRDTVSAVWGGLKTVFNAIKTGGIDFITAAINGFKVVWDSVWNGIKTVVSDAWNGAKTVFGLIKTGGIDIITGAINALKSAWSTVWSGIKTAVSDAWSFIKPIFDTISSAVSKVSGAISTVAGAASKVGGAISGAASKVGSFLGFADGGYVPGVKGQALPATVHSGEYVLSNDMLEGRAPIDPSVAAKLPIPKGVGGGVSGAGAAGNTNDGTTFTHTTILQLDGKTIARTVEKHQLQTGRRRGVAYQEA